MSPETASLLPLLRQDHAVAKDVLVIIIPVIVGAHGVRPYDPDSPAGTQESTLLGKRKSFQNCALREKFKSSAQKYPV
jgi:hypothetical protein